MERYEYLKLLRQTELTDRFWCVSLHFINEACISRVHFSSFTHHFLQIKLYWSKYEISVTPKSLPSSCITHTLAFSTWMSQQNCQYFHWPPWYRIPFLSLTGKPTAASLTEVSVLTGTFSWWTRLTLQNTSNFISKLILVAYLQFHATGFKPEIKCQITTNWSSVKAQHLH